MSAGTAPGRSAQVAATNRTSRAETSPATKRRYLSASAAIVPAARFVSLTAAALGFKWIGSHVYVILPQALRRLLPPLVSLLVNIIQNTTLVGVIGGLDLLEAGKRQNERLAAFPPVGVGESHAFAIFLAVAALFFCLSFPLARLAAYLEKRLVT